MASPRKSYTKQMANKFGYYATWFPTVPLKLGDYGIMQKKYLFVRVGNVHDLGIKFNKRIDTTANSIDYQTSDSVSMDITVGADTKLPNTPISTKIDFTFKKENSVVFKAKGVKSHSIEDQGKLGKEIVKLFANQKWNKKHRVITELVPADSTTIIIASSKSSKLELTASGDISASIDIANAKLGLRVVKAHGMSYTEIAKKGLVPLFRLSGIKKKGFSVTKGGQFQPLSVLKGAEALDLISDEEVRSNPEEYYFGLDDIEELYEDED